jgi:hypothetical protein
MVGKRKFLFMVLILTISVCAVSAGDSRIDKIKVDGDSYTTDKVKDIYPGQFEVNIELQKKYSEYLLTVGDYDSSKLEIINETQDFENYKTFFKAKSTGKANITIYINDPEGEYCGQTTIMLNIKKPEKVGDIRILSPDGVEDDTRVFFSVALDLPKSVVEDQDIKFYWTVRDAAGDDVVNPFFGNNLTKKIAGEGLFYVQVEVTNEQDGEVQRDGSTFYVESTKDEIDVSHMSLTAIAGQPYDFNLTGTLCRENCSIFVYDGQEKIREIDYKKGRYNDFAWTHIFKENGVHNIRVEIRKFAKENPLATAKIQVVVGGSVSQVGVQQNSGQSYYDSSATSHENVNWSYERIQAEEQLKKIEAQNKKSPGFGFLTCIMILVFVSIFFKKKE